MHNQMTRPLSRGCALGAYVSLMLLTLLVVTFLARSLVMVNIDMTSSSAGMLKIHWRDHVGDYSEFKSKDTEVKPGRQSYFVIFWTLAAVDKLAIAPVDVPADITINNITVRSLGYGPIIYNSKQPLQGFKGLSGITDVQVGQQLVSMRTVGNHAQFEFDVAHPPINTQNTALIAWLNCKVGLVLLAVLMVLGFFHGFAHLVGLVVYIAIGFIYISPIANDYAVLKVHMQSPIDNELTVYWADEQRPYAEQQSKRTSTLQGQHVYQVALGKMADIRHVRVDPLTATGQVLINQLEISAFGYDPIVLNAKNQFKGIDFSKNKALKITEHALVFKADNEDAFFEIAFDPQDFKIKHTLELYYCLIAVLALMVALFYALKASYPSIRKINIGVGLFIIGIMLLQLLPDGAYDFYADLLNTKIVLLTIALGMVIGFWYLPTHLCTLYFVIFIALFYQTQLPQIKSIITIELQADLDDHLLVYWAGENGDYQEVKSARLKTYAGIRKYQLNLGSLKDIHNIRVDPLANKGQVSINTIKLSGFGYDPIKLDASNQFKGVAFLKNANLKIAEDSLIFVANHEDAFFEINLDADASKITNTLALCQALLVLLVLMAVLLYVVKLKYNHYYQALAIVNIQVGMVIIGIIIMTMFWVKEDMDVLDIKILLSLAGLGLFSSFLYRRAQLYALYLIVFLVLVVVFNTHLKDQHGTIAIDLQTEVESELVVYWASKFEAYTENKVRRIKTHAGEHVYRLKLGSLSDIYSIRVDPLAAPGQAFIKCITLSEIGYEPMRLTADNGFYAVDFKSNQALKRDKERLRFDADNADAFFEILFNPLSYKASSTLMLCVGLLSSLVLLSLIVSSIKIIYPNSAAKASVIGLKLGGLIVGIMLWQLFFAADYGFFIDYQANKLVITAAGENAQFMPNHLVHIGLLNLAYGLMALLAFIMLGVFYKWADAAYFVAFLLLCAVIGYAIKDKNTLIHIDMDSNVNNWLNVYWADEGEGYQEQHSATIITQPGMHKYTLAIANLNNVHHIRIDPLNNVHGRVEISKIVLEEVGYAGMVFNAQNQFFAVDRILKNKIGNNNATEQLKLEQDKLIYVAKAGGENFIELIVEPDAFKAIYPISFYAKFLGLFAVVMGTLLIAHRYINVFHRPMAVMTIRLCLAIVAVMILQMAWFSEYDVHPDEKAHVDSIDYYTHYWEPPSIGDQRALNAYQYPWGVSRLDDLGISYLLMGKLKTVITYFAEDTIFTCRVFNILLIAWLLWLTRNRYFALFLVPFLCLPQVWHLFSYANRDGFALWLAILLGWQLAYPKSSLFQYLKAINHQPNAWYKLLLPVVLLGLLSIELTNYIIFILYFFTVLVWQSLFLDRWQRKQFFIHCLIVLLAVGSLYGIRKAGDIALNGFHKQEQKMAYAEEIAAPDFKPSIAETDEGYFGLRLRQKGVRAITLFNPRWEWQVLTFKSFTGLYGNEFAEYSPEWYYSYVTYLYVLMALIMLYAVVRYGNLQVWGFTAITVIFVLGDIFMGFLYSWTYDFQPQGRYIFPLIPMLMAYVFKVASFWGNKLKAAMLTCALLLFVLGLFSFRFIALKYLIN